MTIALATVAEFEVWPAVTVTADQYDSAKFLLGAASALVREHTGQTWFTTDSDGIDHLDADRPDVVRDIVVEVAAAVWANPRNVSTDTAGPFTATLAPGVLLLTEAQKLRLIPYMTTEGKPALWTQSTTRGIHDLRYTGREGYPVAFLATSTPGADPLPWDGDPFWPAEDATGADDEVWDWQP